MNKEENSLSQYMIMPYLNLCYREVCNNEVVSISGHKVVLEGEWVASGEVVSTAH